MHVSLFRTQILNISNFLIYYLQIINGFDDSTATCVWYGVCDTSPLGHKLYCADHGEARRLNEEGQDLLKLYCPHLVNGVNNTFTCCDVEQVTYLSMIIFVSISTAFRILTKSHIHCSISRKNLIT